MLSRSLFTLFCFALCLSACVLFHSESEAQELGPVLPAAPESWINTVPVSLEALRGKGVVMYFFEEDCPRCEGRWPELLEVTKKYDGQPVVFLAVNSGSQRSEINSYVQRNNIYWPVVLDQTREFEKQCNVPEISLRNIYQTRIVKPDGKIIMGNSADLDGAARVALQGAKWNVDPAGIPAELKSAWMMAELGEFAKAGPLIKKGLSSRSEETQQAAQLLQAAAMSTIEEQLERAETAQKNNQLWEAYSRYQQIQQQFGAYDLPEELPNTIRELSLNEVVIEEKQAAKELEAAIRTGRRGGAAVRRAVGMLEGLIERHPDSVAAKEAQEILNRVQATSN